MVMQGTMLQLLPLDQTVLPDTHVVDELFRTYHGTLCQK